MHRADSCNSNHSGGICLSRLIFLVSILVDFVSDVDGIVGLLLRINHSNYIQPETKSTSGKEAAKKDERKQPFGGRALCPSY